MIAAEAVKNGAKRSGFVEINQGVTSTHDL